MTKNKAIGKVTGINGTKEHFEFDLDVRDVKHIRRCLKHYDHIHPTDDEDDITKSLIKRFMIFGRSKSNRGYRSKHYFKSNSNKFPQKCAECGTDKNLTIDHIIPLSAGGKDNTTNYQYLCKLHHDKKNLQRRVDSKKEELNILKKRLNVLKK